jgi:4-diphosphocytidyl-2-C-methyl-D-erythritol kinase
MIANTQPISIPAPAKINLYLHITGLSKNGFHELESLVSFASIHDTITLVPAENLDLVIKGPYRNDLPANNNNLVIKAAIALREIAGVNTGAEIILEKNLPVASGIGGGSADCAATLKGLVRLWNINMNSIDLNQLGLKLGSDIPVCLYGQNAIISGRGEVINSAPLLPYFWLVLVNPGVMLSTSEVFEARQKIQKEKWNNSMPLNYSPTTTREFASLLDDRVNDLTEAAISLQPIIGEALKTLQDSDGVLLTRMSGSGATCFGLFADSYYANLAAKNISSNFPDWWVCPTYVSKKQ